MFPGPLRRVRRAGVTAVHGAVAMGLVFLGVAVVVVAMLPDVPVDDTDLAAAARRSGARARPVAPREDDAALREAKAAAADWWRVAEERAWGHLRAGEWFGAVVEIAGPEAQPHLRYSRPSRIGPIEDEVLALAGGSSAREDPDGGLYAVFSKARRMQRSAAVALPTRELVPYVLEWAWTRALTGCAADARRMAARYHAVRFGSAGAREADAAPVQRFQFAEAASRLEQTRRAVATSWAERRVVRRVARLRELQWDWGQVVEALARAARADPGRPIEGLPDTSGAEVVLDPESPPDVHGFSVLVRRSGTVSGRRYRWWQPSHAVAARAVVLPRLGQLDAPTKVRLARIYTEVGEARIAAECLEHAAAGARIDDIALRAEIRAVQALRDISPAAWPADVHASPAVSAWFAEHRDTEAAGVLDGIGVRDLGVPDVAAADAYLEGGLLWAPEQWRRIDALERSATEASLGGRQGFRVSSDHFDVHTDVSRRFAAEAALVLDVAYEQSCAVLGVTEPPRRNAVIFAHRRDYEARHGGSGGCWVEWENTLYTFLDDPSQTRFSAFRYPTLLHEAAHAALDAAARGADVPSWLHEGIACTFERWRPTRSVRVNEVTAGARLRRVHRLADDAASRAGLPHVRELMSIDRRWNVDDFGPETLDRYALAESFMVHVMSDARRRTFLDRLITNLRRDRDFWDDVSGEEIERLSASWHESVRASLDRR